MNSVTPTSCPDLEDYLNGEGLPAYREQVECHLQSCTECRSVIELERAWLGWLRAANEQVPIPPGCRTGLGAISKPPFDQVGIPTSSDRQSMHGWVWLGGLMACAASILIGVYWGTARQEIPSRITAKSPEPQNTPTEVAHVGGVKSQLSIGKGWLIAAHPSSDSEVEVYLVRPVFGLAEVRSQDD